MSRPDARRLVLLAWLAAGVGCGASTDKDIDALFAARKAGGPEAIPILTRALGDGDPRVRALAAWNLGELVAGEGPGTPRDDGVPADGADLSGTAAALVPLLRDPSADVRAAALGALAGFPCRVPDTDLAPMLRDAEAVVRLRAVELLSGCEARVAGMEADRAAAGRLAALTKVLDDPDDDVREAIVRAIEAELARGERTKPGAAPPGDQPATASSGPVPAEPDARGETGPGGEPGTPGDEAAAHAGSTAPDAGSSAPDAIAAAEPPAPDPAAVAAGLERARDLVARLGGAALCDPFPGVRAGAAAVLARERLPEAGEFLQLVTLDTQPLVRQVGREALRSWEMRGLPAPATPPVPRPAKRPPRPAVAASPPVDSEGQSPPEKTKPAEDDPLPAAGEGGTGRSSSR